MLRRDGRWRSRSLEEQLPKLANRFTTDDIIHTNLAMPAGTWMKVFEEAYRACRTRSSFPSFCFSKTEAPGASASMLRCQDFERTHTQRFNTIDRISTTYREVTFLQHKMAPSNLPPIFNATSQDVEMLLAAHCHLGAKNLQVHMEPYLWKRRPDGVNIINIAKTWYETPPRSSNYSLRSL